MLKAIHFNTRQALLFAGLLLLVAVVPAVMDYWLESLPFARVPEDANITAGLISTGFALAGFFIWFFYIREDARGAGIRTRVLFALCASGAFSALLLSVLKSFTPLFALSSPSGTWEYFAEVFVREGLAEESLKIVVLFTALRWFCKELTGQELLVSAAMVALGFSALENLLYFIHRASGNPFFTRLIFSTAGHISRTALAVSVLILFASSSRLRRTIAFTTGLITVSALHALWNFSIRVYSDWQAGELFRLIILLLLVLLWRLVITDNRKDSQGHKVTQAVMGGLDSSLYYPLALALLATADIVIFIRTGSRISAWLIFAEALPVLLVLGLSRCLVRRPGSDKIQKDYLKGR